MSFAGGAGGAISIALQGQSEQFVASFNAAVESLSRFQTAISGTATAASSSAADVSESANTQLSAMRALTESLNMTAQSYKVLSDYAAMFGGSLEEDAAAFLQAASSSADLEARLGLLRAQMNETDAAAARMGGTIKGGSFTANGGGLTALFGGLGGAIGDVLGPMTGFIGQAAAMVTGLIGFSVLNDVIGQVKEFTTSLIDLNIATQKNQFSWMYLYGGGNNPKGQAIAQGMADWTKSFSMQIPYTRQSLLDAITNLAPLGLSAQGLEHYMPMIADLGATRAPNLDLPQVASAIMGAGMGYTRMLKYDLKINPEELIKYGLDATGSGMGMHINDPTTLLPALEGYTKAHGLSGAAKDISHETWWGSWSSFIDRIQNFELTAGQGMFSKLQDQLINLSSWIDGHMPQINAFAEAFGTTLANGVKAGAQVIGDFMQGVGDSGFFDFINSLTGSHDYKTPTNAHQLQGMDAPLATPSDRTTVLNSYYKAVGYNPNLPTGGKNIINRQTMVTSQHNATHGGKLMALNDQGDMRVDAKTVSIWQELGHAVGGAMKDIGDGIAEIQKEMGPWISQALGDLGSSFEKLKANITPDDIQMIKNVGMAIGGLVIGTIVTGIGLLSTGLDLLTWSVNNIAHPFEQFVKDIQHGHNVFEAFFNTYLLDKLQGLGSLLKQQAITWIDQLVAGLYQGIPGLEWVVSAIQSVMSGHGIPSAPNPGKTKPVPGNAHNNQAGGTVSHPLLPYHTPKPVPDSYAGSATIIINGSSTAEINHVIDTTMTKYGGNIASRKPNRGAFTFATYGV